MVVLLRCRWTSPKISIQLPSLKPGLQVEVPSTRATTDSSEAGAVVVASGEECSTVRVVQAMITMFPNIQRLIVSEYHTTSYNKELNQVVRGLNFKVNMKGNNTSVDQKCILLEEEPKMAPVLSGDHPEARESTTQLDERDLLRAIKAQCQLKSGTDNDFPEWLKVFSLCTKFIFQSSTPHYIIDCIGSSIDELYSSPADTIKSPNLHNDTII
ncbi:hypothetical protein LAZ67_11001314 [Cordylochernes scorpioides]|uniref:Uncharacterized protein n=1 Tax=Cordylochernes scorpioides TaxID=51811 RepID=A0ABY6KYD3_9ARAC|nr:hypothetical protein LAZ67_11001314 [Cordylochernes scorpioides]